MTVKITAAMEAELEQSVRNALRDRPAVAGPLAELMTAIRGGSGARLAEELVVRLTVQAHRRAQGETAAVVGRIHETVVRLAEDAEALSGRGGGRAPQLRDADIAQLAADLDEFARLRQRDNAAAGMTPTEQAEAQAVAERAVRGGETPAQPLEEHPAAGPADAAEPAEAPTASRPTLDRAAAERMTQDAIGWGDQILAAYDAGVTFEPGFPMAPLRPADATLRVEMERLRALLDRRRGRPLDPDPAVASREAWALRDRMARVHQMLQSRGEGFVATPDTAPLPPALVPEGAATEPGSPAGRAVETRERFRFRYPQEPEGLDAATLFEELHFADLDVEASGLVRESLDRRNVPGVSLQGKVGLTPSGIAALRTDPLWVGPALVRFLSDWHLSHLIGPGFGREVVVGIMLAPGRLNLAELNNGVEEFLRGFANIKPGEVSVTARARGTRLVVPLQGGRFEHIDVLTSVEYTIPLDALPLGALARDTPRGPATFRADVRPDGSYDVHQQNLPPLAGEQ